MKLPVLHLFIIFVWFGLLKVLLISPAGPLVTSLLQSTFLGFIDPDTFVRYFGVFEVVLGAMILLPKLERITFAILACSISIHDSDASLYDS
jgi:uncharacterized membrane protein YphA (DoxX/SURF4 family)